MLYNYHAHTYRCGHAVGTEREYIERAIANGVKKMGFSDHIPFMHDDGHQAGHRVQVEAVADYFATLKALREEYKKDIELYIGFETEYFPSYFDEMIKFALDAGAEYFILGQHFLDTDRRDDPTGKRCVNMFEPFDSEKLLVKAIDDIISAVETGYISIVAHPDHIHFCGDEKVARREYLRLAEACVKNSVPVEINCLGIRDHRHYPNPKLWELLGGTGVQVVVGFDAHDADGAFDGESIKVAQGMIEKYGLNYLPDPKLRLFNR